MNEFEVKIKVEVAGAVQHHAPCVSECPICHPDTAPAENFVMFGISR